MPRDELQCWLESHKETWRDRAVSIRPDGDAQFVEFDEFGDFVVPQCPCGGLLKPDVVFYGDSVPPERVAEAFAVLQESDGLLVVGSSLMVYSSFRFCRRARELGIPQFAINFGKTRADAWFECKIELDCARVLPQLCRDRPQRPAAGVCEH